MTATNHDIQTKALTSVLDYWGDAMTGNFDGMKPLFRPIGAVNETTHQTNYRQHGSPTFERGTDQIIQGWKDSVAKRGEWFAPVTLQFSIQRVNDQIVNIIANYTIPIFNGGSLNVGQFFQCSPKDGKISNIHNHANEFPTSSSNRASTRSSQKMDTTPVRNAMATVLGYWTDIMNQRFDNLKERFVSYAVFQEGYLTNNGVSGKKEAYHKGIAEIRASWKASVEKYGKWFTPTLSNFRVTLINNGGVFLEADYTISPFGSGSIVVNDKYICTPSGGRIIEIVSTQNYIDPTNEEVAEPALKKRKVQE